MANAGVLAASAKVQESLARKSWGTGKQQTLDIGNGPETPNTLKYCNNVFLSNFKPKRIYLSKSKNEKKSPGTKYIFDIVEYVCS